MSFAICSAHNAKVIDMMMALYHEDPGAQSMTRAKAGATLEHLRLHPQRGGVFTLKYGDELVGYLLLLWYWSNEYGGLLAVVDELYICPPWRRRGFARRALSWVEGLAGIKGVMLEVTPNNGSASKLYQHCGFTHDRNRHLFKLVAGDMPVNPSTTAPAGAPAMTRTAV